MVVEIGSNGAAPRWRYRYRCAARLAGAVGIEPTYDGIKTRCLTAWLRPSLYCGGRAPLHSRSSGRRRLPVVDRELQLECLVRHVDAARHEHLAGRSVDRRKAILRILDAPESLLERGEGAVGARFGDGAKVAVRKTEQPIRQARDG